MFLIGYLLKCYQYETMMLLFQMINQYELDFKILKMMCISIILDVDAL